MTSSDAYLADVRRAMVGMDTSIRDDILRELQGHIAESAAANGGNLEVSLTSLGPAREVGRHYREVYGYGRVYQVLFAVVAFLLAVPSVPVGTVAVGPAVTVPVPWVTANVTGTPARPGGDPSVGGCRGCSRTFTGNVLASEVPTVGVCGVIVNGSAQPMLLKQQVNPPPPRWIIAVAAKSDLGRTRLPSIFMTLRQLPRARSVVPRAPTPIGGRQVTSFAAASASRGLTGTPASDRNSWRC